MGNYKGFGDSKFIPNLPQEKLEALVNALTSSITESNNILELWSLVKDSMFSLDQRKQFLGLGEMVGFMSFSFFLSLCHFINDKICHYRSIVFEKYRPNKHKLM